jgi:hypothetical protein
MLNLALCVALQRPCSKHVSKATQNWSIVSSSVEPTSTPRVGGSAAQSTLPPTTATLILEGGCFGTALQAAIAGDHDEVVDILLDHGADVNTSSAIAEPSDINENGPDYYNLPVKEMKRVTTD